MYPQTKHTIVNNLVATLLKNNKKWWRYEQLEWQRPVRQQSGVRKNSTGRRTRSFFTVVRWMHPCGERINIYIYIFIYLFIYLCLFTSQKKEETYRRLGKHTFNGLFT